MPNIMYKDNFTDYKYESPPESTRENGGAYNTMLVEMEICADSRRGDCAYFVDIEVSTPYIAFKQGFCGWRFRKTE